METFTFSTTILFEGENALLIEEAGERIWLPLSQVDRIVRHPDGTVDLTISAWIAKKKGLL